MNENELVILEDEIDDLPDGHIKINLLEQAIRLADSLNNDWSSFDLRKELVLQCTFFGEPLKVLPAFSWLLNKTDQTDEFGDVLWEYKWILNQSVEYVEFELTKIKELQDDYKRRILNANYTLNSYYYLVMNNNLSLYKFDDAKANYAEFIKTKRDSIGDCRACVASGVADYWLKIGNYAEGLKASKEIFDKNMSCGEVPHCTYGQLMFAALINKDFETAKMCRAKGYKLIADNNDFLSYIGNYFLYESFYSIDKALKMYQKHHSWILNKFSTQDRLLDFHVTSAAMFKRIMKKKNKVKLVLRSEYPVYNKEGKYQTEDLYNFHLMTAKNIADSFNKRNGNTGASERLDLCLKLADIDLPEEKEEA